MALDFHDDAGGPLARWEVEAQEDVFFCDVHIEAFEGDHCPECHDGICDDCRDLVPLGAAAARDGRVIWCRKCVDNDIRAPQPRDPSGPEPEPA